MKNVFILLLFLSNATYGQQAHSPDSLKQFCYFIFGAEGGYFNRVAGRKSHFANGTGFFARIENRTFLISAKHVLTPFSPLDSTFYPYFPDTLYVKVKSAKTNNDTLWSIYVKPIKDTIKGSYFYKDPDVFVMELKDTQSYKFSSLELYFLPNIADSSIQKEVYICGYPSIDSPSFEDLMALPPSSTKVLMKSKLDYVLNIGNGKFDPITYRGEVIEGNFQKGYSGSPVFFKEVNGKYWLFGGVASAFAPAINEVMIVRPNEVLRKFATFFE